MYSPELMKFLLDYTKEEPKTSKKYYDFKDGNSLFSAKKYAPVTITIKNK